MIVQISIFRFTPLVRNDSLRMCSALYCAYIDANNIIASSISIGMWVTPFHASMNPLRSTSDVNYKHSNIMFALQYSRAGRRPAVDHRL